MQPAIRTRKPARQVVLALYEALEAKEATRAGIVSITTRLLSPPGRELKQEQTSCHVETQYCMSLEKRSGQVQCSNPLLYTRNQRQSSMVLFCERSSDKMAGYSNTGKQYYFRYETVFWGKGRPFRTSRRFWSIRRPTPCGDHYGHIEGQGTILEKIG